MNITTDMLNANQRQAVEWGDGPLLVLAGPGSGKTAVLTLRIANLIRNTPDDSFRVLGLTFTVRAAAEMQNRIRDLLGKDTRRVQLGTFHSFCTDVLRQHGSQLGLRPDFAVVTDDRDRVAILGALQDGGGIEIDAPEDSLKRIDMMFTHGITAEELPNYFKAGQEEQCRLLQDVFRGYVQVLVDENQLDFGSMLHFTRELLAGKPRIARQVRTVYCYVCVDEFQDTNAIQFSLARLLAAKHNNICVVGDDDQSIYGWRGADINNILDFERHWDNAKVFKMEQNCKNLKNILKKYTI